MAMKPDTPAEQGDLNLSEARIRHVARTLTGFSRELVRRDADVFLHQALSTPVLNGLARAKGAAIFDTAGREYLDMHGNGVHNAGFNHPGVIEAVRTSLDEDLTFCPRRYTNEPAVALAEKLAAITPEGLARSLFCPGGSEAIEMALSLARLATGGFKTISYWGSFHGAGFAAMSVGGEEHFTKGFGPLLPGALKVDFPDYYRNPWGFEDPADVDAECLRQLERAIATEGAVAAVIGEPISASPAIPSKAYWEGVRQLCDHHGALLIFDEIIEGLGRTGKMFCCEHFVTPDILVLGKSLGGGVLPFAGIVAREELNRVAHYSVGHYTHEKNALCAAAALAEIKTIEDEGLHQRAAELGDYALQRLNEMKARHRLIGHVAGLGLHLGIDLVRDRKTKKRATAEAEAVMYRCLEQGLSFKIIENSIITLRPALVIRRVQLKHALDILDSAIGEVEAYG